MHKLNEKIIKEYYERELKYFQVYDKYRPSYQRTPVTRKFYSKYEALDLSTADEAFVEKIKKFRDKGPKDKCRWPETENQRYGWYTDPLVKLDRDDERLYFPVRKNPITQHDMKLRGDVTMRTEKFTGVPFKLN